MDRPGFEADRFHLVLLDLKSSVKRPLTQNWDRSIESFAWSRDGKLLFATTDHLGPAPAVGHRRGNGRASAITGAGEVEGFSVGSRNVVYTFSNLANPADLYAVGFGGGKTTQLTHLNQAALAQRKLGDYEQFSFAGWNNENVFGYVVKPPDFKPGQKYPVAFVVHGGPQGSMANEWHWRWNAQTLAGAGYGVVMIDFSRLHRLRTGIHRLDQRRLGRQALGGPQAGAGRGSQAISLAPMASTHARSADPTAAT